MKTRATAQPLTPDHLRDRWRGVVLQATLALLLWGYNLVASALQNAPDILIIKSSQAEVYDTVITQIRGQLEHGCPVPSTCRDPGIDSLTADQAAAPVDDQALVITLGLKARDFADRHYPAHNIINAMIPTDNGVRTASTRPLERHPTLILDQPPERNLLLIKQLLPTTGRIGYLYSRANASRVEALAASAAKIGLNLVPTFVDDEADIGKQLSLSFDKIDLLLALPDVKIHNRKNVTSLLLSTYRNRIPVIGFSAAYVKAGALAAVYSTPEDLARHLAEIIVRQLAGEQLPPRVVYPKYFSVSINAQVARSLGIAVLTEPDKIETLIRDAEQ